MWCVRGALCKWPFLHNVSANMWHGVLSVSKPSPLVQLINQKSMIYQRIGSKRVILERVVFEKVQTDSHVAYVYCH